MRISFIFFLSSLFLFSCSSNETKSSHSEIEKEGGKEACHSKETVTPNRLLTIEIKGMVCEMGCGSSIRGALKKTGAICSVDFDFKEEREFNTAKIAFDKNKITVDEIITQITSLSDNQFTVGKSSSEDFSCTSATEEKECASKCSESSKSNISTSSIGVTNILDLVARLF
jgi:periplasmic mercuric ion binding protein